MKMIFLQNYKKIGIIQEIIEIMRQNYSNLTNLPANYK